MARPPDLLILRICIMKAVAQALEKGAGQGPDDARRRGGCAYEYARGLPAIPQPERHSATLLLETRQEVFQELRTAPSVEKACERYLDFALSHTSEYVLYYLYEYKLLLSRGKQRMEQR